MGWEVVFREFFGHVVLLLVGLLDCRSSFPRRHWVNPVPFPPCRQTQPELPAEPQSSGEESSSEDDSDLFVNTNRRQYHESEEESEEEEAA